MEFKLKTYGVNNDSKFVTHNYDKKLSSSKDLARAIAVAVAIVVTVATGWGLQNTINLVTIPNRGTFNYRAV
jgi:hypothetical protein